MDVGMKGKCKDSNLLRKANCLLWEPAQCHYLGENLPSGKINSEVNLPYF